MKHKRLLSILLSFTMIFTYGFTTGVLAEEEPVYTESYITESTAVSAVDEGYVEETVIPDEESYAVDDASYYEEEIVYDDAAVDGQSFTEPEVIDYASDDVAPTDYVDESAGYTESYSVTDEYVDTYSEAAEEIPAVEEPAEFTQGYVKIKKDTVVYKAESTQEEAGTFTEDSIVYAVVTTPGSVTDDSWMWIVFDTEEAKAAEADVPSAYVQYKDAVVLSDDEVTQLTDSMAYDLTVRKYQEKCLPISYYSPKEEIIAATPVQVTEAVTDEALYAVAGNEVQITSQPQDTSAAIGRTVRFTVEASNATEYQWQIDRNDGKGFKDQAESSIWKGTTTNSFSFASATARAGFKFRVVVRNATSEAISNEVMFTIGAPPTIITQPADQVAPLGQPVTFTVAADDATEYQWQIDRNDGKGFKDQAESSIWKGTTTDTMTFTCATVRADFKYRVVVKNSSGEVISNEASLTIGTIGNPPTIVTQPADQIAPLGQPVTFTVAADDATAYQWQIDRNDGKGFKDQAESSIWKGTTTDTMTFTCATVRADFKYRVVVKNSSGEVISNEVSLTIGTIGDPPTIVTQPADQVAPLGQPVTFTVAADDATAYQWQIDRNDGKGFKDQAESSIWKGTTTDTMTFTSATVRAGFKYRVVVKNSNGEVISNEVSFTIGAPPTIITQPTDQMAAIGQPVTFTVVADDATEYQWQIDRNDGKGFKDQAESTIWKGTTTDTLTFTAATARAGFTYRVVVKNAAGEVISNEVHFTPGAEIDGIIFESITSTTCRVASYSGNAESLIVPSIVSGMTVTEIGEAAFMNNTTLESIDLPDSITVIRARAFKNCSNLRSMS